MTGVALATGPLHQVRGPTHLAIACPNLLNKLSFNQSRLPGHLIVVTWAGLKRALNGTYKDVLRHHIFQVSAALSYYFVLAIFPGLILISATLRAFPVPGVFEQVLGLVASLLPVETVHFLQSTLVGAIASQSRAWISLGTLGLVWVVSAAFDALIEALDIAYDVVDPRPIWKNRLLAIGLGAVTGILLITSLTVMILGPRFAQWLAVRILLPKIFVVVWPIIRWIVAVTFAVLSVELCYFLAPRVKQRFAATLPGAVLGVGSWVALSYLLGIYFRHFANYDRIYGTLGAFIVFMTWLYWTAFAFLVGAEFNSELAKESAKGAIPARSAAKTYRSRRRRLDRAA